MDLDPDLAYHLYAVPDPDFFLMWMRMRMNTTIMEACKNKIKICSLTFLLDDRRILMLKAQNLTHLTGPDPDPQHCCIIF